MILAIILSLAATAPAPAASPECAGAVHRQFDFLIGDWIVMDTASGTPIGESRVEAISNGCGLREELKQTVGRGGSVIDYRASSLYAYNGADHRWRQLYVDTRGAAFSYYGAEPSGGQAVLKAEATTPEGVTMANEVTLTPQPDGSITTSSRYTLDGKTWQPGRAFTYRRR